MAATTAMIMGATGLVTSGIQAIDGGTRSKKAQDELNDYDRQELNNAFENVQISTMGSDLLREENARTTANLVNATQQGGARTIIGGVPRITSTTNQINQQAAKMLDDQVRQREYAIAQDNTRIENITENRDNANIAALSSQVDAGRQDMWSGINSGLTSAAMLAQALAKPDDNNDPFAGLDKDFGNGIGYTPQSPYFNKTPLSSVGSSSIKSIEPFLPIQ